MDGELLDNDEVPPNPHAEEEEVVYQEDSTLQSSAASMAAKQKIKSLQSQINDQKRKAAAIAATNQELKQKVQDTQQYALEREKEYEVLAKRQHKAVEDANKNAEKSREFSFWNVHYSISALFLMPTLLWLSCFAKGEDCQV